MGRGTGSIGIADAKLALAGKTSEEEGSLKNG